VDAARGGGRTCTQAVREGNEEDADGGAGTDRGRSSEAGVATAGSGGGVRGRTTGGKDGGAPSANPGIDRTSDDDQGGAGASLGGVTGTRCAGRGGAHEAGRGALCDAPEGRRPGGSAIGTSTSMENESCRDIA